jgi:hypothetical protein
LAKDCGVAFCIRETSYSREVIKPCVAFVYRNQSLIAVGIVRVSWSLSEGFIAQHIGNLHRVQEVAFASLKIIMRNPFVRNRVSEKSTLKDALGRTKIVAVDVNHVYFSEPTGPTLQYAWAVDPEISFESKGTRKKTGKKGVGRLVKKLNCAAPPTSRKEDLNSERRSMNHMQRQMEEPQDIVWEPTRQSQEAQVQGSIWNCAAPQAPQDASRDVLITVNSKGSPSRNVGFNPDVMGAKFVGTSIPRSRGSPGRMSTKSASTPPRTPSTPNRSSPRSERDTLTARKERWLKGIQRGYGDDADVPSRISGDESTGSYGFVAPGAGSTTSYDTDFTTEISSDDSDNYKRSVPRKRIPNSPSRRKAPESRRSRKSRGGGSELWAGVAEDIGIIAGLLLSDGTACVGSVAEITRETVVDGCKPDASDY